MKIAVCTPHAGFVYADFARCLASMAAETAGASVNYNGQLTRPLIAHIFADEGSIELKRTRLALAARQSAADYILWLDADHTFPADTLLRLMMHNLPIVGCNFLNRAGNRATAVMSQDRFVETTREKAEAGEVEQVGAIGFGLVLMKAPVLDVVPKPWFRTEIGEDGACTVGEDVHFCNHARAAGVPIYVDHALSWTAGHIAQRGLSFESASRAAR
jgi:hypothetical protein